MANKTHHVVPNSNAGSDVKKGASGKASSRNQGSEFYIHKKNGRIESIDRNGNETNPKQA